MERHDEENASRKKTTAKKTYRKPTVQVYGTLAEITAKKSSGSKTDAPPNQQPNQT